MNVIQIEDLWKEYRLGVIGHGTLTHDMQSWWARIRGRSDPNARIDSLEQKKRIDGERFWALKGIDLNIRQGELLGIVGKNGAGKSTLLKILSRVTAPSKGNIRIRGRLASLLEVGTGFHPELTGRDNIFMNGAILGMSSAEIREKLDAIVEFSGVEEFIDTPVKRYSSGMYVRLAFAVAAHLEPEILVIDEVLAVGDAEFQKKCLGKMNDISSDGRTILFVSHQMNSIESICSSGIVLDQGIVTFQSENIRDVINTYLSEEGNQQTVTTDWKPDSSVFRNPYFDPFRFYLSNADGEVLKLPVSNNNEIFVNIEFVAERLDSALVFGYDIFDLNHQHIFACNHTDSRQVNWPKIRIGRNHVRSRLPANFLNEGDYHLKLVASLYNRMWLVNPFKNHVSIDLRIRGGLSESPYWTAKRGGIVAPIFPWAVV
jgi:lipopolysaccharide transport system ATP-binding protein